MRVRASSSLQALRSAPSAIEPGEHRSLVAGRQPMRVSRVSGRAHRSHTSDALASAEIVAICATLTTALRRPMRSTARSCGRASSASTLGRPAAEAGFARAREKSSAMESSKLSASMRASVSTKLQPRRSAAQVPDRRWTSRIPSCPVSSTDLSRFSLSPSSQSSNSKGAWPGTWSRAEAPCLTTYRVLEIRAAVGVPRMIRGVTKTSSSRRSSCTWEAALERRYRSSGCRPGTAPSCC